MWEHMAKLYGPEGDGEGHAAVSVLADPDHDIAFPNRK